MQRIHWITRQKQGKGFAYYDNGYLVTDKSEINYYRSLAVPPEWSEVRIAASHDEALINFSLQRARVHAWSVAVRLAALEGDALTAEIDRVDAATAGVAHAVGHPGIAGSAVLLAVRLRERAAPSRVIEVLAAASPPLRT